MNYIGETETDDLVTLQTEGGTLQVTFDRLIVCIKIFGLIGPATLVFKGDI